MTGDDHATGGTAGRFDTYLADSPPGCSVVNWDCIRSTSYIYANSPLTNAQAATTPARASRSRSMRASTDSCQAWPPGGLDSRYYTPQLYAFAAKYTSVPAPVTSRMHCVEWADWATQPKVELAHGIRLDTNYYHYPASWIGNKPGYMTGSGEIMRFADIDGTLIDVYQAHTHMTDESSRRTPRRSTSCSTRASAPGLLRDVRVAEPHRHAPPIRARTRSSPRRRRTERPGHLGEAALDVGRRAEQLGVPRLSWNGSTLGFPMPSARAPTASRRCCRCDAGTERLSAISIGGSPVVHDADHQGHRIRRLQRFFSVLPGDVLVAVRPQPSAR